MNYNDLPYCDGMNCDRKDTCMYHNIEGDNKVREHVDYSTCGSGSMDSNGCNVRYSCGRDGHYMKYKPVSFPTKVSISTLRKEPYENWNHYNYERYNRCPKCNFNLHMTGQVSEQQCFTCFKCNTKFVLNVITEEFTLDPYSK